MTRLDQIGSSKGLNQTPNVLLLAALVLLWSGLPGCTTEKQVQKSPVILANVQSALLQSWQPLCGTLQSGTGNSESSPNGLNFHTDQCSAALFPYLNPEILNMIHPWMKRFQVSQGKNRLVYYLDEHPKPCLTLSMYFISKRASWAFTYHDPNDPAVCKTPHYQRSLPDTRRRLISLAQKWIKILSF
jgi:hypothetical protein